MGELEFNLNDMYSFKEKANGISECDARSENIFLTNSAINRLDCDLRQLREKQSNQTSSKARENWLSMVKNQIKYILNLNKKFKNRSYCR